MITILETIAYISIGLLLYVYVGYPVILLVLSYILPEKKNEQREIFPDVSLIISCFNEEAVIGKKLDNALSIDYPEDKLEIVVVSDASTDSTEDIVRRYADRGVRLIRQEENLGKTSGLNMAVPQTSGEIIVFSDANAMYKPDAISKLVRNFSNEKIGYAVGEAKYIDLDRSAAARSEGAYWRLEIILKKMESYIHSVVGGDGAIYAIRRDLYEKLLSTDINDFVNPLQIILKGYRGVYDTEAVCYEETAGDFRKEFQRKVRIINRSFSGLMRLKPVLNPFKTGFFSFEIISHKLLRWFAPVFIGLFALSSFILALSGIMAFQWMTVFIVMFFWFAYIGYIFEKKSDLDWVYHYPYYFLLTNIASIIGLFRSFRGEVQTTWSHFRDSSDGGKEVHQRGTVTIHLFIVFTVWLMLETIEGLINEPFFAEIAIFWISIFIICYVYLGYPVALNLLNRFFKKPVSKDAKSYPDVALLVCAYNEEEVIEEKIRNSLDIDYPADKFKIVVASDGSDDRTAGIVKEFTDERIILFDYPERRGKTTVINSSVPKIESDIIVFSDANTMYQKEAIKKLVSNFEDSSVGGVSADVILHSEKTTYGKSESLYYLYERWIQKNESEFGSIIGADGGMYAIRKDLFSPPSSNIILDDFVISMNIPLNGYRLVYEEDAIGHEKSTNSPRTEFLRKSRVIAGAIQSVIQGEGVPSIKDRGLFFCYMSHKFLRWMVPVLLAALFLFNLRIAVFSDELIYRALFMVQLIFYLLAFSDIYVSKRRKLAMTSVPFYFCLVNAAALYGIYKGLLDKQTVKWEKFKRGEAY